MRGSPAVAVVAAAAGVVHFQLPFLLLRVLVLTFFVGFNLWF